MNLFQILSYNERVIVWSSEEDGVIITWNQCNTLQMWEHTHHGDDWEEIAVKTIEFNSPVRSSATFGEARQAAKNWMVQ